MYNKNTVCAYYLLILKKLKTPKLLSTTDREPIFLIIKERGLISKLQN